MNLVRNVWHQMGMSLIIRPSESTYLLQFISSLSYLDSTMDFYGLATIQYVMRGLWGSCGGGRAISVCIRDVTTVILASMDFVGDN